MNLLLIGSTGYIGTAVADALEANGHQVVPLVRPSETSTSPRQRIGDLADLPSLREAVTDDIDGIVHTSAPLGDWSADTAAVDVLLDALGDDGVFVYLSGTWVLGASQPDAPASESSPPAPIALVAGREKVETSVLGSPRRGIVVRSGIAYGRGGGIPALMRQWAADGNARWVNDGTDTDTAWATVHVDDLADLIALAVAEAPGGSLLHAVAGASVNVAAIARAADAAAGGNGTAISWPARDAERALGSEFTEALALTQHVTAGRALELGWSPRRRAIIEEYHQGSYAGPGK